MLETLNLFIKEMSIIISSLTIPMERALQMAVVLHLRTKCGISEATVLKIIDRLVKKINRILIMNILGKQDYWLSYGPSKYFEFRFSRWFL